MLKNKFMEGCLPRGSVINSDSGIEITQITHGSITLTNLIPSWIFKIHRIYQIST